jgi:hypothetical protein
VYCRVRPKAGALVIALLGGSYGRVRSGVHVAYREFKYISATPRNRLAFLRLFRVYALQFQRNPAHPLTPAGMQRTFSLRVASTASTKVDAGVTGVVDSAHIQ